jgi:predicted Na+-dependent transporter
MAVMFTQGLELKLSELLAIFKDRPLVMLRSLLVVLVLVPIAALAIILLFKPSPATVIALSILAASPAPPFQLRNIYKKVGSLVYLHALHLSLALLSIITAPTVLYVLSEALGFQAEVSVFEVGKTVGQGHIELRPQPLVRSADGLMLCKYLARQLARALTVLWPLLLAAGGELEDQPA